MVMHDESDIDIEKASPAMKVDGPEVDQRRYAVGRGQDEIYTCGLATCIRVAVIGHYVHPNNTGYDRFLAHVDDLEEPPLQGFRMEVEAAKQNGLTNLEAYIIAPSPGSDDDAVDVLDRRDEIYQIIEALVGASIHQYIHEDTTSWELIIEADKTCVARKE